MLPAPGAPDVLTLATTAYQLYDTYRAAPARFKALSDDIHGLEIVLKRLVNRLILQDIDSKTDLTMDDREALDQMFQLARNLLSELHENVPSSRPQGFRRFKWSQRHVDSMRSRITSLCSIIAALNTSILPPQISASASTDSSQQQILRTLDDLLISIQNLRRPDSITTTLVERDDASVSDSPGEKLWGGLVQEMENHGMSKAQIDEHRETMLEWVARANSGATNGQLDGSSAVMPEEQVESWDVISAVYGPAIVTREMQRMFDVHMRKDISKFLFTVANELFGGDPFFNNMKAFCVVWRKTIRQGHKILFSAPQKVFAREGDEVVIDLATELPCTEYSGSTVGESIQIINASWHNYDVTERIAALVKDGQYSITASCEELLTDDPCYGHHKTLSVTWKYSHTATSSSQFEVDTVVDSGKLEIPPYLNILCANWGGFDVTGFLQPRISHRQILEIDMNNIVSAISHDPWPNRPKAMSIVYQYGSNPFEMLIGGDGAGVISIRPNKMVHRTRNWKLDYDIGDDTTVVAVVWGLQLMPNTPALQKALKEGKIPCTNDFFGLDGWNWVRKTCQVFLRDIKTGEMSCIVGYEEAVLDIHKGLRQGRIERSYSDDSSV